MSILELMGSPHVQRLAVAVGAGMADYLLKRAEKRLGVKTPKAEKAKRKRSAVKKKRV